MARLISNHSRLPRDIKPFAAAHILAGHHVVFAHHIRPELRKTRAVAIVGASGKLTLLGADYPRDFIIRGLMAMWTVERGRFLFKLFVKKIALFHKTRAHLRRERRLLHI